MTGIGTKSRWFDLCAIGFWWTWIGLLLYLFLFNSNYIVFWTLLVIEIALLGTQIWIPCTRNRTRLLYGEMIAMFVALQLVSIASATGNNLYWLDAYYELRATVDIMSSGWNPNLSLLGSVGAYPAVHVFAAQLSLVLGVGVFDVARWIGVIDYTAAFVFYLMFGRILFRDPKVVLLSALPVTFMFYFAMVSGFGRMPLSVALFFLALFLTARYTQDQRVRWSLLSLLTVVSMIFAHPLPPVVLAAFLLWAAILHRSSSGPIRHSRVRKGWVPTLGAARYMMSSLNFAIYVVVLVLAYFSFVSLWSQQLLASTLSVLSGVEPGLPLGTGGATPFYWRVFLYGQATVGGALTVLVLLKLRRVPDRMHFMFLSFAIVLTLWSFASYYLRVEFLRFTLFSWPFLLLAASSSGFELKRKRIVLLLVMALAVVNIAGYYPTTYDRNIAPAQGEWYQYVDSMERAAVLNYNVNGSVVGDWYINMAFLYLRNKTVDTNSSFFLHGYANASSYAFFYLDARDSNWIFTRAANQAGYPKVSDQLYASYQETESMQRVYDNGAVEVYAIVNP